MSNQPIEKTSQVQDVVLFDNNPKSEARACVDCFKPLSGKGKPERCKPCAGRRRYFDKHGKPPERVIVKCEVCEKEFQDYACNRRSASGNFFCSASCRATWVGIHNSASRGGDGMSKAKPEKDAMHYRKNADKIRNGANAYYWNNREKILADKKEADRKTKETVINAYGGKCVCCGESIIEFLTIDHIDGSGGEHRRKIGKKGIYKELIRLGFPKENYRVLCFNCNIVRGFYGYCPHHPEDRQKTNKVPRKPGRKRTVC